MNHYLAIFCVRPLLCAALSRHHRPRWSCRGVQLLRLDGQQRPQHALQRSSGRLSGSSAVQSSASASMLACTKQHSAGAPLAYIYMYALCVQRLLQAAQCAAHSSSAWATCIVCEQLHQHYHHQHPGPGSRIMPLPQHQHVLGAVIHPASACCHSSCLCLIQCTALPPPLVVMCAGCGTWR